MQKVRRICLVLTFMSVLDTMQIKARNEKKVKLPHRQKAHRQKALQEPWIGVNCSRELKRLLADESHFPSFSFLHLTKAGGTTVEWVLSREKKVRNSNRGIYAGEVQYGELHKAQYRFTLLRQPLDRFASYVHFRRYDKRENMRYHGIYTRWSILNFSNFYMRRINGIPDGNDKRYQARFARKYFKASQSATGCEKAKARLQRRFAVVGTSERMLETLALAGFVFKLQNFPIYGRVNQQLNNPGTGGLSEEIQAQFEQLNNCDTELYALANTMLNDALYCLGQPFKSYLKSFKEKQEEFSRLNPVCIKDCVTYGTWHVHGKV